MFEFIIILVGSYVGGFYGAAVGSAGLLIIPLLILLGMPPHMAVGTSRPGAAILELSSTLRFWRDGKLKKREVRSGVLLGIVAACGAIVGAEIVNRITADELNLLFSVVIGIMFLLIFLGKNLGLKEKPSLQKKILPLCICTFAAAIFGGFFGFSFGTLMMIVLLFFGYALMESAIIARLVGVFLSTASSVVFALHGSIHYPWAIAVAIGFGAGAWLGAGVAAKKGNGYIRALLTVIVLLSVLKLLFDYVSGL